MQLTDRERVIKQDIYDHGGSRIWIEQNGDRELVADTYQSKEFAEAVKKLVDEWYGPLAKLAAPEPAGLDALLKVCEESPHAVANMV